ncbi:hypothetical protein FGIG_09263 [Fasciola gigantica]|uniref:Uncharacterized protein n=1 Tax=Fasciola gigantica TaxID=46835 RepID=A0A504Y7F3_FASGI|nr:hypothetical protein FGIG_09263 [Fasciola gigantica]
MHTNVHTNINAYKLHLISSHYLPPHGIHNMVLLASSFRNVSSVTSSRYYRIVIRVHGEPARPNVMQKSSAWKYKDIHFHNDIPKVSHSSKNPYMKLTDS